MLYQEYDDTFYENYIMCWEAIRLCCRDMFGFPSVNIYESRRRYPRSPTITTIKEPFPVHEEKAFENVQKVLRGENQEEEEVFRCQDRRDEFKGSHDKKIEIDPIHREVEELLSGQISRIGSESNQSRLRCDTYQGQDDTVIRLSPSDQGSEWFYISD